MLVKIWEELITEESSTLLAGKKIEKNPL